MKLTPPLVDRDHPTNWLDEPAFDPLSLYTTITVLPKTSVLVSLCVSAVVASSEGSLTRAFGSAAKSRRVSIDSTRASEMYLRTQQPNPIALPPFRLLGERGTKRLLA